MRMACVIFRVHSSYDHLLLRVLSRGFELVAYFAPSHVSLVGIYDGIIVS